MGHPTALFQLALCLVCTLAASARAQTPAIAPANTEDSWMSVLLGSRKIGSLHIERQRDGQTVTTTQTLAILLTRNNKGVPLGNTVRSVETRDGQPLAEL